MPIVVNGEPLDQSEIRRQADVIRERLAQESPGLDHLEFEMQIWEEARQVVIDRILLRQAALADATPIPAEIIDAAVARVKAETPGESRCLSPDTDGDLRAALEADLKIQRFIEKAAAGIARPKNGEIAEYYRKNRDRFYQPEQIHASHIVKNVDERCDEAAALEAIKTAAEAIATGKPFGEVADEFSDCPGRGGELGFFGRGDMVEEFENVVFNLREGEVSGIFSTPFGFHIAKLHEKRRSGYRPLAEARAEIEAAILAERRSAMLEKIVLELRERAVIRKTGAARS